MSATQRVPEDPKGSGIIRPSGGKKRFSKAGNDLDTFPFEKLSIDGAAMARNIISPMESPFFAALRARDPFAERDSTDETHRNSSSDSTGSSGSSDDDPLHSSENSGKLASGEIKDTTSSKKSKQHQKKKQKSKQLNNNEGAKVSVKDLKTLFSQQTTKNSDRPGQLQRKSLSRRSDSTDETELESPESSPETSKHVNRKIDEALQKDASPEFARPEVVPKVPVQTPGLVRSRSIDPDADHISGIFRRSQYIPSPEKDIVSEADSYYEVAESDEGCTTDDEMEMSTYYTETVVESEVEASPRRDPIANNRRSSGQTYYSTDVSSGGWDSVMSSSVETEVAASRPSGRRGEKRPIHRSIIERNNPNGSSRISPDGKVHISPSGRVYKEAAMPVKMPVQHPLPTKPGKYARQQAQLDPDGPMGYDDDDNVRSTHGEDMSPTTNEEYKSKISSSTMGYGNRSSNEAQYENSSSEDEYSKIDSDYIETPPSSDVDSPQSSVSAPKRRPIFSAFPSNGLLACMAVMILLIALGLAAGLTYYLLERNVVDPIRPPDTEGEDIKIEIVEDNEVSSPALKSDDELLNLFESVVGEAARSPFTSAGMAASWMIDEDPGKTLKVRSDQGWIQRYLLVYTYYATTLNQETSWLSCNPPTGDVSNPGMDDPDACKFTYPTELPGGEIIYDIVPSYRWLSAADECQWGGVACSKTVIDGINGVESTVSRLAVTSITLADQYLKGSIVTALTQLPELTMLDLSHNGLEGTLSENFRTLETLRLQNNAIQGTIPSNFFDDKSMMKELNLGSNFMTGTIPNQVGFAPRMSSLYLFENNFSGRIPPLGSMPLINFQAQRNSLTGILPFDYDYSGPWPDTLRQWWVYDNQLTGSLSANLGFLSSLEDLRVDDNVLTGKIPETIADLQRLFRFDAQKNLLTGTVPEGIGDLPVLRDVKLQFNRLEGIVPTSLCFRDSMEVLAADCLAFIEGVPPQTDCYCCTTCCNPRDKSCQIY